MSKYRITRAKPTNVYTHGPAHAAANEQSPIMRPIKAAPCESGSALILAGRVKE